MPTSTSTLAFYGVVFTRKNPPQTYTGETLTSLDLEGLEGLECLEVGYLQTNDLQNALIIPESVLVVCEDTGKCPDDPATRLEVRPGWTRRLEDGLAKLCIINAPPPGWYFAWQTN